MGGGRGGGYLPPLAGHGWLEECAGQLPRHSREIVALKNFILKQGVQGLIRYTMFLPLIFTFCDSGFNSLGP